MGLGYRRPDLEDPAIRLIRLRLLQRYKASSGLLSDFGEQKLCVLLDPSELACA